MLTGEPERKLRSHPRSRAVQKNAGRRDPRTRRHGAAWRDEPEPPCTPPGISDSHACTAALNAGELSFSPWCVDVHAAAGERRVGEVRHAMGADARRRLQVLRLFPRADLVVRARARTTARQQLAAGLLGRLELGIAGDARV